VRRCFCGPSIGKSPSTEAGYEIDNVSDLARVFRVPGSYNHKSGTRKLVVVIRYQPDVRFDWDAVERLLAPELEGEGRHEPEARRRRLADHDLIQERCGWYGEVTGSGAAHASEPDWYAGASISARCRSGEEILHAYSRNHPGYDEREAAEKFRRASDDAGPRTCAAVAELGNEHHCSACPYRGKVTTPLQLGYAYHAGEEGPLPIGYTQDGDYVLVDQQRRIVIAASAQQLLSQQYLIGLAPTPFWRDQFPAGPKAKAAFAAMAAGEAIIEACKWAGPFRTSKVRGRGI
jgi:hypothetical protein